MINHLKLCSVVLVIAVFICSCTYGGSVEVSHINAETQQELITVPLPEKRIYERDELEQTLAGIISKSIGNWSVYIEALNDDFELELNNTVVSSASTIKLFNMVTVYDEVKKGRLRLSKDLRSNLRSMITVSSNDASNAVVTSIGGGDFFKGAEKVTKLAQRMGCTDTQEKSRLYNVSGPSTGRNTTTVKDCGIILRKLYNEQCILPVYDKEMLKLLKQQERDWKIPSGVPEGTVVANKTGENSKVELDVGIVFSPECDYILCISVTGFRSPQVYNTFSDISKATYEFFNRDAIGSADS